MYIYLLVNQINGKKYVGQSRRPVEALERLKEHWTRYKWENAPLIDSKIGEYGVENFSYEILHSNIGTQEELDALEKQEIKELETHISTGKGYNLKWGGFGGAHAEETKAKIGDAQKGSLNHMYGKKGSDNATSKKIMEIFTQVIYSSATEASEVLGISQSKVCASARGDRISVGGYVFQYLDDNNNPIPKTGSADYPVKCVETGREYSSSAEAEYSMFGSITGVIAKSIPRGHKSKNYRFERLC